MLFEGSKPSKAFSVGIKQGVILFSSSTLSELEDVLWRKKFDQYISHEERKQFLSSFILHSTPVEINETITECRDPKDNKFLELVVCGKADFIISGDKDFHLAIPPAFSPGNTMISIEREPECAFRGSRLVLISNFTDLAQCHRSAKLPTSKLSINISFFF